MIQPVLSLLNKIAERLHLNIRLTAFNKDSHSTSQSSGGDSLNHSIKTTQIVVNSLDEAAAFYKKIGQEQEAGLNKITQQKKKKISISLGFDIGIVKETQGVKTRVHLEFAVFNDEDSPKAVQGLLLRINNGTTHFKQFFKVLEDGSRAPAPSIRFPYMINGKGGANFAVEFENIDIELIRDNLNKGELIVILNDRIVAKKKFDFTIDKIMKRQLIETQINVNKTMQPQIIPVMIKSDL